MMEEIITKQEEQRILEITALMKQYIEEHGLSEAQRTLAEANRPAFRRMILGEMVLAGWLHPDAG
ncbi:MAG: hypothetical protein IKZ87_08770 [Actinomycetaceae bacterium]|nr:hypothetical protein [Actinomycetaceae bacterium]